MQAIRRAPTETSRTLFTPRPREEKQHVRKVGEKLKEESRSFYDMEFKKELQGVEPKQTQHPASTAVAWKIKEEHVPITIREIISVVQTYGEFHGYEEWSNDYFTRYLSNQDTKSKNGSGIDSQGGRQWLRRHI